MSSNSKVFVIGSGPAGYGAARRLKELDVPSRILEKNSYFGGHCATFKFDGGFVFDDGPHISFTKDERIKELFVDNADRDVNEFVPYVDNYWHGYWVKHPAITSLHGLPADMNTQILMELIELQKQPRDAPIEHYEQWLRRSYGDTYAERFPMDYTVKYHTTEARNMTVDWLGPRLYEAQLDEVIFGMLSAENPDRHYISYSRYPNRDGFANFLSEVTEVAPIDYGHEVTEIDIRAKTLTLNGNRVVDFDRLVSSMPLDALISRIPAAPREVSDAAQALACTQAVIVNLGINRPNLSKAHWSYIYDRDISFTRLSFPYKFSPKTVPEGCSSVQAELYYSHKYRPFDTTVEQCVEDTIRDLVRIGLLESADEVIFKKGWITPYAQVIFDQDRTAAVKLVHEFLREEGIEYCGRFGDWAYIWSDESFRSGELAAERLLENGGG